jgi:N-sulfoglucosamine sulfohydrolase
MGRREARSVWPKFHALRETNSVPGAGEVVEESGAWDALLEIERNESSEAARSMILLKGLNSNHHDGFAGSRLEAERKGLFNLFLRMRFLILLGSCVLFSAACAPTKKPASRSPSSLSSPAKSAARPPNILLILGDDLGPQLHCYGDSIARTPSFDRLAREGVRFTNAFVTQSSCSPSRSSIFTGLYPHQNGQLGLAPEFSMHPQIPTLPRILKAAGYRTGIVGKIHVLPESALAFDYVDEMKADLEEETRPIKEGERVPRVDRRSRDVHAMAALATTFLEGDPSRPFFLVVSFPDPHRPFEPQVAGIPAEPLLPGDVAALPFLGFDTMAIREHVAGYYNSVERLDHGVGLVLAALADAGLESTTLVIASGDQGPPFARAKGTCYEAGIQVPLLIRWPGIGAEGAVSNALVSTIDLMPTILEIVGCESPSGLEGKSLAALLRPSTTNDPPPSSAFRTHLFSEFNSHGILGHYPRRAVRDERYKLILNLEHERPNPFIEIGSDVTWSESRRPEYKGTDVRRLYDEFASPPAVELYDLQADPWEMKNLAGDAKHQTVSDGLLRILTEWRSATCDTVGVNAAKK